MLSKNILITKSKVNKNLRVILANVKLYKNYNSMTDENLSSAFSTLTISGNEKRKESCKKVGGKKKKAGHKIEDYFKKQFNPNSIDDRTEYGATSDTSIASDHNVLSLLKEKLDFDSETYYVSNKSGRNLQFVLGNINELNIDNNLEWIQNEENSRSLFNKYLKKIESNKPSDLLAYYDESKKKWVFMVMNEIIHFISTKCKWRKLNSGRLKGDFDDNSNKGCRQYLTYEYRGTHGSHFLGANGNKGKPFIKLLKNEIKYVEVDFDY